MSERSITLREAQDRLRGLQVKYKFSSDDFRNKPECRSQVTGEDEFDWESFLVHSEVLREQEEELQGQYLAVVVPGESADTSKAVLDLVA